MFTTIDLSKLDAPAVIETLSYEEILQSLKDFAVSVLPDLGPVLVLESEPATKVLEVCALHILMLRQRVNEAAQAVMLASAVGTDLDHLGALMGVERQEVTQATDADPAVMETDDDFRARIQLAPEAFTSAGSIGAYTYHALSADGRVKGAEVDSPEPGTVRIVILAANGTGVPDAETLAAVRDAVSADDVRPLTDLVIVEPVELLPYQVEATLHVAGGPDVDVVLDAARAALNAYVAAAKALSGTASVSGIMAALHQGGVISVDLASPLSDVGGQFGKAPDCTAISIALEVE